MSALIGTLAPFLFRQVEKLFRPGTGSTKMDAVLDAIKAIVGRAGTAGESETLPEDDALRKILEGLLTKEKSKASWEEKGILKANGKTFIVQILGEL